MKILALSTVLMLHCFEIPCLEIIFSILCLKTARIDQIRRHYLVFYIQYVYPFSLYVQFCIRIFFFMIIQLEEKSQLQDKNYTYSQKTQKTIRQACSE